MKITLHKEPFHFLYLEDVYDKNELKLIWQELEFLNTNDKLLLPEKTSSATGDYYFNIYQTASDDSTAAIQFDIAYGHKGGSGSTYYLLSTRSLVLAIKM